MTSNPNVPDPYAGNPFQGTDSYATAPDRKRHWSARLIPSPSLAFYSRMIWVVERAGRQAKRGLYDGPTWTKSSLDILRLLEDVGANVRVEGLTQLDRLKGPAVIVGNHMSTLETFVLPSMIRPRFPVTFVVKHSLLDYPFFGPVMRSRKPIAVGRASPREDLALVLREGVKRLEKGISIIVFPQTTRTTEFDPSKFNSIGAKLAARAGVELLPLALDTEAWGNGKRLRDFGPIRPELPVRFRFGTPIAPDGRGAQAHHKTSAFIRNTLLEWRSPSNEEEEENGAG